MVRSEKRREKRERIGAEWFMWKKPTQIQKGVTPEE